MKKKKIQPRKKMGFFTKVAVIVFLGFCIITIVQMTTQIGSRKKEIDQANRQIAEYQAQIEALENELATPLDYNYIRKIAKSKLGYSMPDDVIFYNDLSD